MVVASGARDALAPSISRDVFVRAGDVRLSLKVPAIRGSFSLAGKVVATLPSGDAQRFVGANYATVTPTVVWSYNVGRFTVGGEGGYRLRRRAALGSLEVDDEIHLLALSLL